MKLKDAIELIKDRIYVNAKPVRISLTKNKVAKRRFVKDKPREASKMSNVLSVPLRKCCTGVWDWPLYIWGPAGIGKTCAGLLTTDWVESSYYWTIDRLAAIFAEALCGRLFSTGPAQELLTWDDMVEKISRADLVVLDEIGKGLRNGRASDHQKRVLQAVLDSRERMATVLLGNYDVAELSVIFDPYIASRIQVGTLVSCAKMRDRRVAPE